MGFNKLLKKKKLRLKRLLFPLMSFGLLAAAIVFMLPDFEEEPQESPVYQPMIGNREQQSLLRQTANYNVLKRNVYVCGDEIVQMGTLSGAEIAALLERNGDWRLTWETDGSVVLNESIDDLTPGCKGNVYIGLDADGNLALFEGKPDRSKPDRNKVLQTFFQIDIEYLESSLPKQSVDRLYEGIRIHNYAQYNEVLSTFAGFAVEAAPR